MVSSASRRRLGLFKPRAAFLYQTRFETLSSIEAT